MPLGQRPGDKSDSRYCGVETEFIDDMPHVLTHNLSGGFDFVLAPLVDPNYRPSLSTNNAGEGFVLPVAASDLIVSPAQWSSHVVGLPMINLKDIVPAATNTINTQFILLEKGNFSQDMQETTCLAMVADETASLHFQLWGDECRSFEPGDIIRLTNGIFSYHRSHLVLRAGRKGKAEKVGEFNMLFVETPNMCEIKWAKDPNNPRKFVQEAVISPHSRIFPPFP